jgi:hypothetical protein
MQRLEKFANLANINPPVIQYGDDGSTNIFFPHVRDPQTGNPITGSGASLISATHDLEKQLDAAIASNTYEIQLG